MSTFSPARGNKFGTILGREPAAWVGLIEAALFVGLAFGIGLTQETSAAIMGVVVAGLGVYTAWVTKDTMLGVIVGLLKAGIILGAAYGFNFTDEQNAAIVALTTVIVGLFQRESTSPVIEGEVVRSAYVDAEHDFLAEETFGEEPVQ